MRGIVLLLLMATCGLGTLAALTASLSPAGLASLKDGETELLCDGTPAVQYVILEEKGTKEDGTAEYRFERRENETPQTTFNLTKKTLTQVYSWGNATYTYIPAPNRLDIVVTLTNTSPKTLANFGISLATVKLPAKPEGYNAGRANLKSSYDNVALTMLPIADRQLVLCNVTMAPPVSLGFDKAADAAGQVFPICMAGGVQAVEAGAYTIPPHGQPRVAPGTSLALTLTLRMKGADDTNEMLLADIYTAFAAYYAPMHQWTDRRPIGMVMLPSKGHISDNNPRGWFGEKALDITTPEGKVKFRDGMMKAADMAVKALKDTGAQGMIVWDLEGDENPHPITYIGDPRMMAKLDPEMDEIADAFFKKFTDAGLKTGCCIRPTQVYWNEAKQKWDHGTGSDGGPGRGNDYAELRPADVPWWKFFPVVERLSDKIAYAKKRWGCTIFYVDTNGIYRPQGEKDAYQWQLISAVMWRQIMQRHPDVLIIPELNSGDGAYHLAYWAYAAQYMEMDLNGYGTPAHVRAVLPGAFSLVNVNDGPIDEKRAVLVDAVRRGDILMFRGWFGDPRNKTVKAIYEEATAAKP
jgi:hypothetical protein